MKRYVFVMIAVITVTSCSKYPDLGDGYKLDSDGKYTLQIIDSENNVIVNPHILEYANDTTYIIVSQRSWESITNIVKMDYKESIEAFEKSRILHYWIIDKKMRNEYSFDTLTKRAKYSNVYGPLTIEEFIHKRQELQIPEELRLSEE